MKKQSTVPDGKPKKTTPATTRKRSLKETKPPGKIGKYKIDGVVAQGGMGILYKAIHPTLKRPVVIKKLIYKRGNPELKERFKQEASVMMDLNHENIVRVFDHFTDGSNAYIVEEFIDGISLDQLLQQEGPLSLEKLLPILLETANALEYIHSRGVVHRDIKPSNILIVQSQTPNDQNKDRIKITDFGIAATENSEGLTVKNTLTSVGTPLGSPLFMAPEQRGNSLKSTNNIDARADIYSLALLTYISIFADLPPLSRFQLWCATSGLPRFLRSFIFKGLAENRRRRPKNLSQFIIQSTKLNKQISSSPENSGLNSPVNHKQNKRDPLFLKVAIAFAAILMITLFLKFGIKPLFFQLLAADQWGGLDIVIPVDENYMLSPETTPTVAITRGSDLKTIQPKLKNGTSGFESQRVYFREGETVQVTITTPIGLFTEYKTISSFSQGEAETITSPKIGNESAPVEIGFSVFDDKSGDDITNLCNISLAIKDQWVLLRNIPPSKREDIFVNGRSYRFLLECSGYKELQLPVFIPSGRRFMINRIHMEPVEGN